VVIIQIEVSSLRYRNGSFSLGPVSFKADRGEVFGIGGPNGSGKSTLIRLILGLLKPANGSVIIDGKNIGTITQREISRRISYLPQSLFSPLNLSVQDVLLASEYSMVDRNESLSDLIEYFGLNSLKHRDFNTLSGGEKRIVMFAGAVHQGSDIIVMDEPDTFLDIDKEIFLFNEIKKLSSSGKLIITIFHDLNKLRDTCDRVLLLKSGKQIAYGKSNEVLIPDVLETIYSAKFLLDEGKTGTRIIATRQ
jgi:iron complex transport system ATP-binding protein